MCRFLIAASESPVKPASLLSNFADLAARSPAPDGDWQGDGWGAAWIEAGGGWRETKSLRPIWEDRGVFDALPAGEAFCAHARSASFPLHKDRLDFNQPFVGGGWAFVFNGLLRGVSFPTPVAGEIGAQKIWTLLSERLAEMPPETALDEVVRLVRSRAKQIQALNLAITDGRGIHAYSSFESDEDYYRLWTAEAPGLSIICSGPLPGFDFRPIPNGGQVRLGPVR
jgi:predicted glutamine amidotransferase